MNNKVIYTSLTGGYDDLPQYPVTDPEFDYICFSNEYPDGSKVGMWTIRKIPFESPDNIRLSRFVKLNPHIALPEYDYSVWLDSNLIITGQQPYQQIKDVIATGTKWAGIVHPECDCIYDEAQRCAVGGKSTYHAAKKQVRFLKKEGYPRHHGLFENNFIIRKHNNDEVRTIDDEWWQLYTTYSKRDQLSLFYLFWKHAFTPDKIYPAGKSTHNIDGISRIRHNDRTGFKYFFVRVRRRLTSMYARRFPIA